jgi:hypothetical protein
MTCVFDSAAVEVVLRIGFGARFFLLARFSHAREVLVASGA